MRRIAVVPCLFVLAVPLFAQTRLRGVLPGQARAESAERIVKQAAERFADEKKIWDRDMGVLQHLKNADVALTDSMQPAAAIQKAYEEVGAAKELGPDFIVAQGLIRVHDQLEAARRSPASADFDQLRSSLRREAVGPAARVVVRAATDREAEILAWLKVQQAIADHLRMLSEVTGESLRAAEQ